MTKPLALAARQIGVHLVKLAACHPNWTRVVHSLQKSPCLRHWWLAAPMQDIWDNNCAIVTSNAHFQMCLGTTGRRDLLAGSQVINDLMDYDGRAGCGHAWCDSVTLTIRNGRSRDDAHIGQRGQIGIVRAVPLSLKWRG